MFGTYPYVSLAAARELYADARKLLRASINPKPKKKAESEPGPTPDPNTFEVLRALAWLSKMPVAAIKPRDILAVIQRVQARGAIDSALSGALIAIPRTL